MPMKHNEIQWQIFVNLGQSGQDSQWPEAEHPGQG